MIVQDLYLVKQHLEYTDISTGLTLFISKAQRLFHKGVTALCGVNLLLFSSTK